MWKFGETICSALTVFGSDCDPQQLWMLLVGVVWGGGSERTHPGLLPPEGVLAEAWVRFGGRAMRFPVAGTAADQLILFTDHPLTESLIWIGCSSVMAVASHYR